LPVRRPLRRLGGDRSSPDGGGRGRGRIVEPLRVAASAEWLAVGVGAPVGRDVSDTLNNHSAPDARLVVELVAGVESLLGGPLGRAGVLVSGANRSSQASLVIVVGRSAAQVPAFAGSLVPESFLLGALRACLCGLRVFVVGAIVGRVGVSLKVPDGLILFWHRLEGGDCVRPRWASWSAGGPQQPPCARHRLRGWARGRGSRPLELRRRGLGRAGLRAQLAPHRPGGQRSFR
jgi:hypothetical protein